MCVLMCDFIFQVLYLIADDEKYFDVEHKRIFCLVGICGDKMMLSLNQSLAEPLGKSWIFPLKFRGPGNS